MNGCLLFDNIKEICIITQYLYIVTMIQKIQK